ncbi:inositol monophosphatase family domain-containing protein [Ditylenchus destructor]|uniref:Inositol-1-monophosphatase n=1 Tax=Ditylenchus destructor TaxID=166010 RepID=A0AAD4R553_9BILA|nr:inositol monophosphatase family domain-containing protein [Ditylenchus destructor]
MSNNGQHQEDVFFRTALDLVNKAGQLVRDAFHQPASNVTCKGEATDLVTETDKLVEDTIVSGLSAKFPDHMFIGEESTAAGKQNVLTDSPTWIIDPIDGTNNFVHRVPLLAICVGLAVKKKLRAGIIYNPISTELFSAQAGKGATKNGFPIRVSKIKALNKAIICTPLGAHPGNIAKRGVGILDTVLENRRKSTLAGVHGQLVLGSAAINMAYLAQGSVDAYVDYGLRAWDYAAGVVIVREAGGLVVDPSASTSNSLSNYTTFAEVQQIFTG